MDTGNDDITVDLLDDEDHDAEDDRIGRFTNEENQCTGNCADEGTKDRNNIGDGNNNADQRSIGHTRNLNEQKANKADQNRIEDGSNEIFSEGSVCQRYEIRNFVIILFTEKGFRYFFRLRNDIFLCAKEIYCEYEAKDDVEECGRNRLKNFLHHREVFLQKIIGTRCKIVYIGKCRIYNSRNGFIALSELLGKRLQRSDVFGKFLNEIFQADSQLRNDHRDEERQKSNDGQNRCRYGKTSSR